MLKNYKSHIAFKNIPTIYIPNPLYSTILDFNEKVESTLFKHVFKQNTFTTKNKEKKNITKKRISKKRISKKN